MIQGVYFTKLWSNWIFTELQLVTEGEFGAQDCNGARVCYGNNCGLHVQLLPDPSSAFLCPDGNARCDGSVDNDRNAMGLRSDVTEGERGAKYSLVVCKR